VTDKPHPVLTAGVYDADDALSRYVFLVEPQVLHTGGDNWVAWYPHTQWSVTAATEANAHEDLRVNFAERSHIEYHMQVAREFYEQHLAAPIPGIHAMDAELYDHLKDGPQAVLDAAFAESERRRRHGRHLTRADLLRNQDETGGEP
jgi:hypothetical protein